MISDLITLFRQDIAVFITVTVILGLLVGSFLNVVIYRLPLMLEASWRSQCNDLLNLDAAAEVASSPPFNLIVPRSRCPKCGHSIGALENIPIVSYLLQKGRCKHCGTPISLRYPLVELLTAVLSGVVVWHFGFGWQALLALLLTWALVALSFIDLDHQLLPDDITLPVLWLGIGASVFAIFTSSHDSIIGAMAGYLSLWSVYHLFRLLTGKEGMGHGDFKLLALFGAWLGWQYLPAVILLSSVVGAIVGIALILFRGHQRQIPIPFGPYLAVAGWIAMLWGPAINNAYLRWVGLG